MNTPRLCNLRSVFPRPLVLLLAGFLGLAPLSARGQFATVLDTTARFAGNSTGSNVFNGDTGVATATTLDVPSYVVFDSLGNLYISDTQNNCVRKVDTTGQVTTVAGLRVSGNASDTCDTSTNPAPTDVQGLLQPTGLAIDSSNTLYIADSQHNCVRSLASGVVDNYAHPALTTVAGTCSSVHTGSNTPLPDGLAVDSNSNLYISIVDSLYAQAINQVVRHLATDPATTICAVAGQLSPNAANSFCTGINSTVTLDRPAGLAFDKNGNLFIADSNNNCVREIAGMTTQQTAVGQCVNDLSGGTATPLNNPYGLAFSADASLYISESATNHNNVVSYNFATNALTPIAGLPSGASGSYNSSQDGQSALTVPLNQPLGITTDAGGTLYLADSQNNIVRKMGTSLAFPPTNVGSISANQTVVFSINQGVNLTLTIGARYIGVEYNIVSTTCNGAQSPSTTCQVVINFQPSRPGYRYSALQLRDSISGKLISIELQGLGIGPLSLLAPGVASTLAHATGLRTAIAVSTDSAGDAYVLEKGNGSTTADVLFYPVGGGAAQVVVAQGAGMVTPTAMAVDGAGNIFIADSGVAGLGGGNIIRFGADGTVNTSYATGLPGVTAMAVDGFDDLFLAIAGSFHDVTEIYAGGQRRSVAGNGSVVAPNNVVATSALFYAPSAIALGPNGIAVADAGSHYVYLIDNSGIIHIVAGNGTTSTSNASLATGTAILTPDGLAIDAAGDIYIADNTANIVYAVYSIISNGTDIYPVIGTGTAGYTGDGGPSTAATINAPLAIALDGSSDLFVVDSGNDVVREVTYPVTSTISFGAVPVNTTSTPPMLQFLANAGNANLVFSSFPFTTTDTVHYAAVPGSPTTCTTATVVSGGVCDIGYTFHPTAIGPAPAGQSNLISNSYNSQQTVIFSTSGSSGYATVPLPFSLISETEVYGYSFSESFTFSGSLPASGTMIFYIGSQTLCTTAITNASAGTITCNAAASGLAVGSYTVNFTFTSSNAFYSSVTGTTTLNVTKAPLTINVNNVSRQYGQPNPSFSGTISGAVNGDTFSVTYSTTATITSPVGTYPINATVTGANIANYNLTVNPGTLTITQAGSGGSGGLVVTVNCTSRAYGQPNPTFTYSLSGAVNGDIFTVTLSTTATQFSPVGNYTINTNVTGANINDYVVTVNTCTLSVVPTSSVTPVVSVNNASRMYGQPNPTFTSITTGTLNGDTFTINYSTPATQFSPIGTYPINATVSGAAAANYAHITVVNGTLTITPTTLVTPVVTVNNASRPYGQPNPTFTSNTAGAFNGDTFTVNYSTTATQFSPVGTYPINATVSGAAAANYASITVVPGTLNITPAGTGGTPGLVVTPNSYSRPYGTPNPTFTGTITGELNGDTFNVTYSTTATIASPVGTYPITATLTPVGSANLSNYVVTYNVGTLTITPTTAQLVVTVFNASRPYGTPNPTFNSTISGALNGDTFTVNYSTPATITSPVGAYPINATLSGPAAANYSDIIVDPGTLSITTAINPLVVRVNNASRPYGTANPTFTSTISGALNGDSVTVIYSTTATITSPVGTYPINATVSGAAAANYNVTVVPGTLTVTTATAPLVVTVNNASRPYGTANPTFTSTISGALNGDSVTVIYSTTATITSPAGTYPINATIAGPAAANYNITVVPGTLTITPTGTPLVVTVNNASRPYGTANPTFTSTIAGALNGDTFTVTYSTTATIASPIGTYPITATVTGANIANYTVTVVPGVLSITPPATATVVTTSASPVPQGTSVTFTATVTYGAGLPVPPPGNVNFYNGMTLLGTGALNALGIATYSTSTLPAGSLTITATYQATPNYASSSGTVLQVVTPGSFTVSAVPPNQFIRGAGSTAYAVTITSIQDFAGPVSLACSGLPADASCTFADPTVTLTAGGSANTTLTVVNTEADARLALPALPSSPGRKPSGLSPIAFAAAFPFGLGAFLVGLARRRRGLQPGRARASQSPRVRLLLVLFCAAAIISLAGCACLTSTYQVYTIPITATSSVSGASTQTASVTLTVAQQ